MPDVVFAKFFVEVIYKTGVILLPFSLDLYLPLIFGSIKNLGPSRSKFRAWEDYSPYKQMLPSDSLTPVVLPFEIPDQREEV